MFALGLAFLLIGEILEIRHIIHALDKESTFVVASLIDHAIFGE